MSLAASTLPSAAFARRGSPPRARWAWDPSTAWQGSLAAWDVMAATHAGPEAVEALRRARWARLATHARRHSPVFRRLLGTPGAALPAWHDVAPSRRADLMARFDEWVTDPSLRLDELRRFLDDRATVGEPYPGGYAVWESSGSTGEPAVFVNDSAALAVYDALEALRRPGLMSPYSLGASSAWTSRLRGVPGLGGARMVFVGAVDGHFASVVAVERLRALSPWAASSVHALSFLLPAHELAARLEAVAPTILAAYPSTALVLAAEREAGRLRASPREIWTGGETLDAAVRARLVRAFDAPVHDAYGCSECLALASSCRLGRLHLNADWAILESVDDDYRPVPDGTAGTRTLLTNLANLVQPVIRLDLGDQVTMDARPCACGRAGPTLTVRGRVDDTLRLRPGRSPVLVSPLALCTVLEDDCGLYEFQVCQSGPEALELRVREGAAVDAQRLRGAAETLAHFLAAQGAPGVIVGTRRVRELAHGRSGKVARVVAATPPQAGPRRR